MTHDEDINGGPDAARCDRGVLHIGECDCDAQDDESDRLQLLHTLKALHAKYARPPTTQQVASEPEAAKLLARDEVENATRRLEVEDEQE